MQPQPSSPLSPESPTSPRFPDISEDLPFVDVVRTLAVHVSDIIIVPYTFEQLRTGQGSFLLTPLIDFLSAECHHRHIVSALLALKWQYTDLDPDDRGINESRGYACEIVAWRFVAHLSEPETLDYLLYELPARKPARSGLLSPLSFSYRSEPPTETTSLLDDAADHDRGLHPPSRTPLLPSNEQEADPTSRFGGLNALEIATIASAKKFLAQRSVQKIVNAIWRGDIIFWASLSVTTVKHPQKYNPHHGSADPYTRLRVPKYQKLFEALFFASFLALYYAVLIERHPERITALEALLYVWLAAFAYEELGELRDTGSLFYVADVWNLWDLAIVLVGAAFVVARVVALSRGDAAALNVSFDVLSLLALFLVPRLCSILSVHPYFGTLIPCLKEMTKDFLKFLVIVLILYLGFLTTFAMLARDAFSLGHIAWVLVYVFFGSSYMGFDVATRISEALGPPLMIAFVCITNILLVTSLISLLTNSLTKVMDHAREEYLFQYSVFVLEASASRRLTYYLPPLNLIPLVLFRPLRLCVPGEKLRSLRILLLKATHFPFVAAIWAYEHAVWRWWWGQNDGVEESTEPTEVWHLPLGPRLHTRALSSQAYPQTQIQTTPSKSVLDRVRHDHYRFDPSPTTKSSSLAALMSRSEVSLVRHPGRGEDRHGSTAADGQAAGDEQSDASIAADLRELKRMVARLGTHVDELRSRLDQQPRPAGSEDDEG